MHHMMHFFDQVIAFGPRLPYDYNRPPPPVFSSLMSFERHQPPQDHRRPDDLMHNNQHLHEEEEEDEDVIINGPAAHRNMDTSFQEESSYNVQVRDRFRRKLKYYFMNPLDKWKMKGKLPWKLGLQIVKIIVVTLQLLVFGSNMSKYLTHQGNMVVTFRELFMSDWDTVREVMTYPPAAGPYAVYTKEDFYIHVNHVVTTYASLTDSAIGLFGYGRNISDHNPMSAISFCKEYYAHGIAEPTYYFYNYTNIRNYDCIDVKNETLMPGDPLWTDFSIQTYLEKANFSIHFDSLLKIVMILPVRTIYLNTLDPADEPDCYSINVTIEYDNSAHDGQVMISLTSYGHRRTCTGDIANNDDYRKTYERIALNILVIALCSLSLCLCTRSVYRGNKLRREAVTFFKTNFGVQLSFSDQMNFLDCWILMIIANDMLIILGSVLKLMMERRVYESSNFSTCSLFLGIGNLLVWMGLLRYLGFFRKYNVLILTMKRALPNVIRFMMCTLLLYGGFCLCGWLVLGPYHIKFKNLSTTSECLFSLLNGDDMFATFEALNPKGDSLIWWFSRLYLYCFISLFIYIILSLFISIIMDAYDTIKNYYESGFPLSHFQKFIIESPEDTLPSDFVSSSDRRATGHLLRNAVTELWARVCGTDRTTYQRI
jgi:mucolipin